MNKIQGLAPSDLRSEILTQNIDTARISIIIPVLNEARNIKQAVASTQPSTNVEVIVVDGGSNDGTVEIAESLGVKLISAPRGRAAQMNAGALAASGEILLFLHADSRLSAGFDIMVRTALQQPGVVAGAFAVQDRRTAMEFAVGGMGGELAIAFFANALWRSSHFCDKTNISRNR
jgi:glycosyltransferase involved in cell wall biosynthesis